jgi:NADPH:quinone reductase-like Zn-dependent oxidoreductase
MNLPSTMLAARSHRVGAAAELQIDTVPVPQPGPGQVLIRVESASFNFSDIKRRRGNAYPFPTALPCTPGGEVAGTVAALGAGVTAPALTCLPLQDAALAHRLLETRQTLGKLVLKPW